MRKMRYKGSNEWIGKGVHDVEVVSGSVRTETTHVYVMDIGWVRRLRYETPEDFLEDWEDIRMDDVSNDSVILDRVKPFANIAPDKEHALKVLEEAAEVFAAWQLFHEPCKANSELLDECADVIQATCNLVAAMGVEDFRPWLRRCEKRNEEKGRYGPISGEEI